jgi:hypothetical protein
MALMSVDQVHIRPLSKLHVYLTAGYHWSGYAADGGWVTA